MLSGIRFSAGRLLVSSSPSNIVTIDVEATVSDAVALFQKKGISQVPCTDQGQLAGILTETDVLQVLVDGRATRETSIAEVMVRTVSTVSMHDGAAELPAIFARGEVALVTDAERKVLGLLGKIDLINFLANRPAA